MRALSVPPLALAAVAMASCLVEAGAAEAPSKLDLSVGYVFLWVENGGPKTLPLGLAAGIGFNPSSSVGLVADAGVSYNEGAEAVNEAALLGGLRYTFRRSSFSPYVEALGGGARRSVTASATRVTAWDGAVQAGTGLLMRLRPGSYLRASVDFRNVFGEGASARRVRFLVGATLGLGRSGRGGSTADAAPRSGTPAPLGPPAPSPATTTRAPSPTAPVSEPAPEPATTPTPSEPSSSSNIVQFPTQQPTAPTAKQAIPPPTPPAAPSGRHLPEDFAQGTQLLRSGRYTDASNAFQASLRARTGAFALAVGLFCEEANVAQLVKSSGDSEPLFVIASPRGSRTCYALYWGVFASQVDAQRALGTMPSALRARGQAPVAVSRLLR